MIESQRQQLILDKLKAEGFVSVRGLMKEMNASRSTIMRDLITMEAEGKLVREHGGASLVDGKTIDSASEPATAAKEMIHAEEKKVIARKAAEGLKNHECVYIDSGTTTVFMVPYLSDKNLILVTPSIYLIRHLPENFKGKIILLGGDYDPKYDMSTGALTIDAIHQFHFNHAFFTAGGFSIHRNEASVSTIELGAVKKAVMERSSINDLLVDSSKLEATAICTCFKLDEMDHVYTDEGIQARKLPENFVICGK